MTIVIVSLCIAYLIGSIPTGYCIAQVKGIADIRNYGSGNIGATNVGRRFGLLYFLITLFVDASKAYGVLWLIFSQTGSFCIVYMSAWALLFGNAYSILLRFKGGKGVATTIGILFFLHFSVALVFVLFWLLYMLWLQNAGMASVASVWSSVFGYRLMGLCYVLPYSKTLMLLLIGIAIMITWWHKTNLQYFFNYAKA